MGEAGEDHGDSVIGWEREIGESNMGLELFDDCSENRI